MILAIILLVLIILNLITISIFAFLGKKNLLLVFAIIEAVLAIMFPIVINLK